MEKKLTEEEFKEITKTWFYRLEEEISTAGCNNLYSDEFPQSVCERFSDDLEVLEVWKRMFFEKIELLQGSFTSNITELE